MRVVFHIHDESMWITCLANVKNFLEMGQDEQEIKVEVVANGPAIKGYLNGSICQKIEHFIQTDHVTFSSCQKAMVNQGIKESDFLTKITIVPSGVFRLVELQQQHFSYIKV
ncbi:DsrE family protein [Melissococcus sp. OM08-11BH]|uniref:DsrE family protein n=1 Tax=Melissococcus sp. OM08-11BH TaxID=2293110 RepID=UPI000E4CEEE9|nr:DsrE family protein [Melissococcus sp. OM08-11BH]RGI32320.1 sulfur reduction protein DsrE [Melissococcus sp. OM08-11BH]